MSTDADHLRRRIADSCDRIGRTVRIMEVCGTHTVSIFRNGIRSLLPANLQLVSGPGCPVCVTAQRHIDAAIELAARDGVILATYGDMIRVPGRSGSLEQLRAGGAHIRVVNSAMAAVELARANPQRAVVFLAVGFETTAPATAVAVLEAQRAGLENFSVLMCHKLVVPAMEALLQDDGVPLDGFLCPGHVSVIIGAGAYRPIVERFNRPCVVAGFEPMQILTGLFHLVEQVRNLRGERRADGSQLASSGTNQNNVLRRPQGADATRSGGGPFRLARLENVYGAAVSDEGNVVAQRLLSEVFVLADTPWRALGVIPGSGLELAPAYRRFDAAERFELQFGDDEDDPRCRCGEVIQGKVEPAECSLFDQECTPLTPIGPCMVSSEGTCAAWYKYNRVRV